VAAAAALGRAGVNEGGPRAGLSSPVSGTGKASPGSKVHSDPDAQQMDRLLRQPDLCTGRVGGRLREFLPAWLDMSEDPWVHSVVRQGFRIQFSERFPPLLAKPVYQSQYTDKIRRLALDQVIIDYLSKGAISILDYPPGPGFYSRVFLVPKRSGKWRMVIDLSSLNLFTKVEAFKMESVDSIRQSLKIGEWAASIDLSDAYLHVPIHVSSQKFLRFAIGGKVYQCLALPFGLSAAPYVFTRIMKTVAACCHRKGLRYHVYLDDSLCPAVTASACHSQVQQIKTIMENLGFLINIKKSEMIPAQQFTFLGVAFDLRNGLVSPAAHRLVTFQDLLRSLIGQTTATPRKLHRLLGHMESFSRILPGARAAKRELQLRLNQLWDYLHWDQPLSLEKWFLPTIQPWRDQDFLLQKSPLHQPHPTQSLYTDACETGWGAHLETLHVSGKWEPEMTGRHINFLEMEAVNRAVSAFSSQMLNQVTLLRTDNTTVAAYINKEGGAHSQDLCRLSVSILRKVWELQGHLIALHIRGESNVLADSLSRRGKIVHTEWTIHQGTLNSIFETWGKPLIDLFATRLNHRLPLYVSPVQDPLAWSVDALALDWTGLDAYAFPPPILLSRVLEKIRSESCSVILLAPNWPAQPWFPLLLSLLIEVPVKLSLRRDLLMQPQSRLIHQKPEVYRLHAWKLSNVPSKIEVFRNKLPSSSLQSDDYLLKRYISRIGGAGWIGQTADRWIPVIHL
jgi:hypothetical protein